MDLSIIIVTRNRARDLASTLASLRGIHVPDTMRAELLVVDNGSTDETRAVVSQSDIGPIEIRYIHEPCPGLSHGRNSGLRESRGGMILFTDDDIRPPTNWVEEMTRPILDGQAEAVCGGVEIAPHLLRPWMTTLHRCLLASTEWLEKPQNVSMVGANMSFVRHVLDKVPAFDTELGSGALGSCEELLFSKQLIAAGYRIRKCLHSRVMHHFDPARLKRGSWLRAVRQMGASHAYIGHHWEHWPCKLTRFRLLVSGFTMHSRSQPGRENEEGCPESELKRHMNHSLLKAHASESSRPRNYERHGLRKLGSP